MLWSAFSITIYVNGRYVHRTAWLPGVSPKGANQGCQLRLSDLAPLGGTLGTRRGTNRRRALSHQESRMSPILRFARDNADRDFVGDQCKTHTLTEPLDAIRPIPKPDAVLPRRDGPEQLDEIDDEGPRLMGF